MLLLQLYSLFSAHIMFAVFSLYLLSTARTLPAFGITVQILYDTCNFTLNVINYDCHSFAVLLLIFCGCQTHFYYIIGGLFTKVFYSTASSGGLFLLKLQKSSVYFSMHGAVIYIRICTVILKSRSFL
jgi:hypothetical protein